MATLRNNAIAGNPSTLIIDGREYVLHPIGHREFIAAEAFILQTRLNNLLEGLRTTQFVRLTDTVIATMLSNLSGQNIDLTDALSTHSGRCFLVWKSIQLGAPQVSLADVHALPGVTIDLLMKIVAEITGLAVKEKPVPLVESGSSASTAGGGGMNGQKNPTGAV